mmetsp:Transcript_4427/g.8511  ORF Transcript_4427/g.8511 Transcript_4427/m.8511 type:complete len:80 (-) Transcript_4427:971-1210(-)
MREYAQPPKKTRDGGSKDGRVDQPPEASIQNLTGPRHNQEHTSNQIQQEAVKHPQTSRQKSCQWGHFAKGKENRERLER